MKTLGNILWHFPFFGFISAISVYLLGLLLTATIIAAPIGLGLMEFGKFLFSPFGHAMVSKSDLNIAQNKAWKVYSTVVMVLYLPFGLLFAFGALIQVALLFCSIIGIPVALVVAKSLGTYLNPVNKKCVSSAVSEELERRKGQAEVEKYLGGQDRPAIPAPSNTVSTPDVEPERVEPARVALQPAVAADAPPIAGSTDTTAPKWLVPGVLAGLVLLVGGGYFLFKGKKSEPPGAVPAQAVPVQVASQGAPSANAARYLAELSALVDKGGLKLPASARETMKQCLNAGCDPNARPKGHPLINLAAMSGFVDVLQMLVERGVDVNGGSGQHDEAPLYSAILGAQTEAAFYLVEKGADVNRRRFDGFRPLDAFDGGQYTGQPEMERLIATMVAKGAKGREQAPSKPGGAQPAPPPQFDASPVTSVMRAAASMTWPSVDSQVAAIRLRAPAIAPGDRKRSRSLNSEGLQAVKTDQYAAAVDVFQRGLEADPSDIEVRNNLGFAYHLAGRTDDAIAALMNVLVLAPDRTAAWTNLSQALAVKGDAQNVVAAMRLAVRFSGDRARTREYFSKFAATHSNPVFRTSAESVLRDMDQIPRQANDRSVDGPAKPAAPKPTAQKREVQNAPAQQPTPVAPQAAPQPASPRDPRESCRQGNFIAQSICESRVCSRDPTFADHPRCKEVKALESQKGPSTPAF